MRAVYLVAALAAAFLLGAFVEHWAGAPFGLIGLPGARSASVTPAQRADASTAVPQVSTVRGQQDGLRNDVVQGATTDFQRCVNTMIVRREPEAEARTVCQKIMAGIGG